MKKPGEEFCKRVSLRNKIALQASKSHGVHPPFKILEKEQAGGDALGCASELGSMLPDFNYSIIIGVRVATLAYQFNIYNWLGSVLGSAWFRLGSTWFQAAAFSV